MKPIIRIAILSSLVCLTAKAAPFMAVGDNAELFVTAGAKIQADDNIYLNSTGTSDTIYSFTPGLDLVFGKGSATTGDLYYNEEIRRFSSKTKQNVDLASVGATASYSNGLTKAGFNASYAQVAQNQVGATLVSDIARHNLTNLGGNTEFSVSGKTSLAIGVTYVDTDYIPTAFTSSKVTSVPIDVYYKATPKLDWSLGYAYRSSSLSGSADNNQDNFFHLGARGEFTPKLTGEVKVGITERSFNHAGSQSLLGLNSNLTYAYSEKTSIQLNVSNDFDNAGTGDSTKNLSFGGNITSKMTEQWSVNAALSWRSVEYPTRTDDLVNGSVGVTYIYNTYLNFKADYTYQNNGSNKSSAGSEFTDNMFSIGANVRY